MQRAFPRFSRFIPGIAWFILVMVLLCMPGRDLPKTGWLDQIHFDKFIHALLFGGILLGFAWPYHRATLPQTEKRQYYLRLLIATVLWGLATEFIQKLFIPGRSFDLADWLADAAGAGGMYWMMGRLKRGETGMMDHGDRAAQNYPDHLR